MQKRIFLSLVVLCAIFFNPFSVQAEEFATETVLTAAQVERIQAAFDEILMSREKVTLTVRRHLTIGPILFVYDPDHVQVTRQSATEYYIAWQDASRQAYYFNAGQRRLIVFVDDLVLQRQMSSDEISQLVQCLRNLKQYRETDVSNSLPAPAPTPIISPIMDID